MKILGRECCTHTTHAKEKRGRRMKRTDTYSYVQYRERREFANGVGERRGRGSLLLGCHSCLYCVHVN